MKPRPARRAPRVTTVFLGTLIGLTLSGRVDSSPHREGPVETLPPEAAWSPGQPGWMPPFSVEHGDGAIVDSMGFWVSGAAPESDLAPLGPIGSLWVDYWHLASHVELRLSSPAARHGVTQGVVDALGAVRLPWRAAADRRLPTDQFRCVELGRLGLESVPYPQPGLSCEGATPRGAPAWSPRMAARDPAPIVIRASPVGCMDGQTHTVETVIQDSVQAGSWTGGLLPSGLAPGDIRRSASVPPLPVGWILVMTVGVPSDHPLAAELPSFTATHYGITRDMCDSDALAAVDPTFEPDELDIVERSARTFSWVLDNGLQALQSHPEWPWPVTEVTTPHL